MQVTGAYPFQYSGTIGIKVSPTRVKATFTKKALRSPEQQNARPNFSPFIAIHSHQGQEVCLLGPSDPCHAQRLQQEVLLARRPQG